MVNQLVVSPRRLAATAACNILGRNEVSFAAHAKLIQINIFANLL